MAKLNINQLRSLIKETLDHDSAKTVVTCASKLLSSIDSFKKDATPTMINSVTPNLDEIYAILEDMVQSPLSYVKKSTDTVQKISLKQIK